MRTHPSEAAWKRFDSIQISDAAKRLQGVAERTPLVKLELAARIDPRIDLRFKLENRQVTGSFKARGAWNQVSQLAPRERAAGVVCPSSGNHGKALAWAAEKAGIPATIVMPAGSYPNKIQACRDHGAEVVLSATRELADTDCAERVARGMTLVHPYDAARTIEGAGTVGMEIAEEWPDVDVVITPVGGGGLISGTSLALRRVLGTRVKIFGAEPRGAPSLTRGIESGRPIVLKEITSKVQGLIPLYSGQINIDVCSATLDGIVLVEDEQVFAAQKTLARAGERVEPGGSAAAAVVFERLLPAAVFEKLAPGEKLRVAIVVSGGNPEPAQFEKLQAEIASERSGASSDRSASRDAANKPTDRSSTRRTS